LPVDNNVTKASRRAILLPSEVRYFPNLLIGKVQSGQGAGQSLASRAGADFRQED